VTFRFFIEKAIDRLSKPVTRDGVPISRIFKDEDFGYRTITVERPQHAVSCAMAAHKFTLKVEPFSYERLTASIR
jgi:hypothetical protein